jgi:hypothetical protein
MNIAAIAERLNSKPVTALIALIALVSFPLSLWFWWDSKSDPGLTYYVAPAPTVLATPGVLPGLSIQVQGRSISMPVYASRIYVWNSGRRAVRDGDLLPSLRLKPSGAARDDIEVLWASVAAVSREEIQPRLQIQSDKKAVLPQWLILDEDDGFVLDVIYQAAYPSPWQLAGSVAGQKKIEVWASNSPSDSVTRSGVPRPIWVQLVAVVGPFLVMLCGTAFLIRYTSANSRKRWVGLFVLLACSVSLMYLIVQKKLGTPPILLV